MLETVDNNNGSHRELGSSAFMAINSLGDDKMTGGGWFDEFNLTEGFGQAEITDFYDHIDTSGGFLNLSDLISAPKSDWANFNVFYGDAHTSGANVIVNAPNGDLVEARQHEFSLPCRPIPPTSSSRKPSMGAMGLSARPERRPFGSGAGSPASGPDGEASSAGSTPELDVVHRRDLGRVRSWARISARVRRSRTLVIASRAATMTAGPGRS